MSQQTTIRKLAELVNTPVEKLLEQLAEAGMKFSGPDQVVTSMEKVKLLGFLKRSHGKAEAAADDAAPKKITLARRKVQEVTVKSGRSASTVNVEVRQKRTYVKPGDNQAPPTTSANEPDPERAEILRKLEESKRRNLDEQQQLAEIDKRRAEERERQRQEEAARAEAEAQRLREEAAAAAADSDDETPRPARAGAGGHHVPRSPAPPARREAPRNDGAASTPCKAGACISHGAVRVSTPASN
ncbi:translation initiation factor IF-2 associated domain-containing protein, partial [Pseudoxanthomonas helianthi]